MDCERYELILDVATEGFWDWDLVSDRAYLSPRYCALIGYAPEDTVFDSAFLKTIIHPEDWERVSTMVQAHLDGKYATSVIEYRMMSKDGNILWVEGRGKVVARDGEGRPTRMVGTIVDITERKLSEEAFRHSTDLLNNLSQQVPGALFQTLISPDGHICTPYSSEKLHDIYEVSPDQIRRNIDAIADRFHPDDRERIFASIAEATATLNQWECEYRVILPQQGLKWLYGIATPQRLDNGTVTFYGIIMDITERKRLERELNDHRRFLADMVEFSGMLIAVKDLEGRYVTVNRRWEDVTGLSRHDVLGKSDEEIFPYPIGSALRANDLEAIEGGRCIEKEEMLDDEVRGRRYGISVKFPLKNEDGSTRGVCVMSTDITERKRAEEERLHLEQQLLQARKLESLGVLAGGIAHDFNNILTGVIGNISFARSLLDTTHKSADILLMAERAANRAAALSNQLLTFAKGSQPVKTVVSVRRMLEESAAFVLRGSNVSCDLRIPDDLPAMEVDAGQISQVLNNIIINAAQAMPGGGTITVAADSAAIGADNQLSLSPGSYVRLSVTDTGCGITEDDQQRIFDPYFTTKTSGSGLGLASAHSIVVKHGGHIGVRSVVGAGSTFEVLLPASEKQATHHNDDATSVQFGTHRGLSVLVMDDEDIIRDMTRFMLDDLGYLVQTCSSGAEAVALYQAAQESGAPFSIVVMDLTIPGGMGGKETAQQIKALDPNARLIVSSGYSTDPVLADYTRYGFCATLLKPYSLEDLTRVLDGVLTQQR